LKRSLHVVDDSRDPPVRAPASLDIGGWLVSVAGTGDGVSSLRFVDVLIEAGAVRVDSSADLKFNTHIVIRETPKSPEARLRAETAEEAADVVLGCARPVFARLFASACARWVNS
jgi:hypothetical protein